jgi:hypothetical protein
MHNGKPRDRVVNAQLRSWIITQRQSKKHGELEVEREQKLNSIGFEWSPYSKQWEQMFGMLRQFHSDHGHCRVPAKWPKNPKLASWVAVQRARKPAGKVSTERIAALDTIGFSWRIGRSGGHPSNETWDAMYALLKQFHSENGNANVPQQFAANRKLGWWVTTQRRNKRKGKLTTSQIAQLDELDFDWSPFGDPSHDGRWEKMMTALETYKKEHGNCRVPAQWEENPKLANWVATQRRHKKLGELKPERVTALERIGFDWRIEAKNRPHHPRNINTQTAAQDWEAMFLALKEYKQTHGNCLVPQRWKQNHKLADWVSNQRMARKREKLEADKAQRLEELGFSWDPVTARWEEMFQQLVEFKKEHDHTNVPERTGKYRELSNWVRNQRAAKRYKRPIMAERAKRMEGIGFIWCLVEPMSWEKMFAALVEFKRVHDHCNVPQKSREHKSLEQKRLGKWVNTQRTQHYRGKLRADRKQLLDSIGFIWNARPNYLLVKR